MNITQEVAEQAMELVEDNLSTTCGVCIECVSVQGGVEPDAERYTCETCGKQTVYGAEQILLLTM